MVIESDYRVYFIYKRHEPIWQSYYSSQVQFLFVLICKTQVSSLFHVKTEQICEILPVFRTKIKESKFRTKKKTFSYPPDCLSRKRMGIYKCKTPIIVIEYSLPEPFDLLQNEEKPSSKALHGPAWVLLPETQVRG